MGPIGSKVIEVKGQIHVVFFLFVPPRSLGQSSPNLVGRLREALDFSSRGSFFKSQGHRGRRSNLSFFFSFPLCMSYLRLCVCMCVSYLSSSPQSSYCYVETGKIY